jgi:hypothetical protein
MLLQWLDDQGFGLWGKQEEQIDVTQGAQLRRDRSRPSAIEGDRGGQLAVLAGVGRTGA